MRLAMILAIGLTLGACGGSGGDTEVAVDVVDGCLKTTVKSLVGWSPMYIFELDCPVYGSVVCLSGADRYGGFTCDWSNWVAPNDDGGDQ